MAFVGLWPLTGTPCKDSWQFGGLPIQEWMPQLVRALVRQTWGLWFKPHFIQIFFAHLILIWTVPSQFFFIFLKSSINIKRGMHLRFPKLPLSGLHFFSLLASYSKGVDSGLHGISGFMTHDWNPTSSKDSWQFGRQPIYGWIFQLVGSLRQTRAPGSNHTSFK